MATKLFVGGLPYSVTNPQLENMFTQFGTVTSVNIITDRYSGQSKGFGFIEMQNDNEATNAIKQLDGTEIDGRKIAVSVARPKEERPSFENRNNYRRDFKNSDRRHRN